MNLSIRAKESFPFQEGSASEDDIIVVKDTPATTANKSNRQKINEDSDTESEQGIVRVTP